jgi:hypothetical protein
MQRNMSFWLANVLIIVCKGTQMYLWLANVLIMHVKLILGNLMSVQLYIN